MLLRLLGQALSRRHGSTKVPIINVQEPVTLARPRTAEVNKSVKNGKETTYQ